MISIEEYNGKIKKMTKEELIEERKRVISLIEFYESKGIDKENLEIYSAYHEYLIECLKIYKESGYIKVEEKEKEKLTMHSGDIVIINNKKYTIEVVADTVNGVKLSKNTIEVHVLLKKLDDYQFIKRTFNKYKKNLKL